MRGKAVVGQSGGPTAVINNTLVGIIHEAKEHPEIEAIYGALHGIKGVLEEDFIDLTREPPSVLEGLRKTPGAALGTIRYKVKEEDYERLLKVFKAHNIRYFFYIGGNDSMDTANKLSILAEKANYEMRVIGVPKTIDNDLAHTDHCPGYGSAARFVAMAVRDSGWDTMAMRFNSPVKIIEVMGRNAGWLTGASVLGKEREDDPPHLIYVPERPLSQEKLLQDVERAYKLYGYVVIALSEGVCTEEGEPFGGKFAPKEVDAFGHVLKGGASDAAASIIKNKLGLKVRIDKPNYLYRSFMACASKVDLEEAYRVGRAAVKAAVSGETAKMVTLIREANNNGYRATTGLVELEKVANVERHMPDEYINQEGNFVTEAFIEYARPLIGEPLPLYTRLIGVRVPKKLTV
ncbi:MAG: 6-phosphofructokinase [Chloroflexi bacterium]|nr:MAG: 6-phosphofructokinase [Chloroflexota bacterium]HDN79223.1 6-phosphofructokinase [Chloroflexota bacterium]